MISCDTFDEWLPEATEGGLDPSLRAEFELHLAACPPCLTILTGYVRAMTLAAAAYPEADEPTTPLPSALVASLVAHVRAAVAAEDRASGVA